MKPVKIACVGDIMLGDSFYNLGSGVGTSLKKNSEDFLPEDIKLFFKSHDIVFCNMESVLSDVKKNKLSLRSMHMRGNPKAAEYLKEWGFTVANVANNHILEHGTAAAIDTVKNLEKTGLKTIGAGREKKFQEELDVEIFSKNNREFAFLGACLRNEKYAYQGTADLERIIDITKELSQNGKIVCISLHWGNEYIDRPEPEQLKLGHRLIDAGAKLIIGHHPHVFQGIEEYKNGLIAYSLGNFIFAGFHPDTKWSGILSIEIDNSQIKYKTYPIVKENSHHPSFAENKTQEQLSNEIKRRSETINTIEHNQEYFNTYKDQLKNTTNQARKQMRKHLMSNLPKMNPVFWPQILLRPIQRRAGKW